jgi:hypothetical protein
MGRRRTAGMLVVVLGLAGLAGCTSTSSAGADPSTAAATSDTPDAGAIAALAKLNAWFARADTADMTMGTVQTTRPSNPIVTMVQLTGTADVLTGAAQMTGGRQQTSGGGSISVVDAVAAAGQFYTTVPPHNNASGQPVADPMYWTRSALSTVQGLDSRHSIWWLALHDLKKVHVDGTGTIGKNAATEYTGEVDLSQVAGIPPAVLQEEFFKQTGSTELSVDLYTDVDTGALVQLTYRMGLKVSIDAEPSGKSVSGFQVDLNSFGAPTPLVPPVVVPADKYIVSGGNDDLCMLLFF